MKIIKDKVLIYKKITNKKEKNQYLISIERYADEKFKMRSSV